MLLRFTRTVKENPYQALFGCSSPLGQLLFIALAALLLSSCEKEDLFKHYEGTYHGIVRKSQYKPESGTYDVVVDTAATALVSGIEKGNITVSVTSTAAPPSPATFTGRFSAANRFGSSQGAAHGVQTTSLTGMFSGDTLRLSHEVRYSGTLHYSLELVARREP